MTDINKIGPRGEAIAVRFLESKGYQILERNYRYKQAEVDIMACNEQFLVIVEVKSRSSLWFGAPEAAINAQKIEQLCLAAGYYQELHDIRKEIRFDVITVHFPKEKTARLRHIPDAFHG
jgi:putative endonuclease